MIVSLITNRQRCCNISNYIHNDLIKIKSSGNLGSETDEFIISELKIRNLYFIIQKLTVYEYYEKVIRKIFNAKIFGFKK